MPSCTDIGADQRQLILGADRCDERGNRIHGAVTASRSGTSPRPRQALVAAEQRMIQRPAMKLRARLASSEEKPALWPICDACYPPYADYRARTSRDIPIFVCEARG